MSFTLSLTDEQKRIIRFFPEDGQGVLIDCVPGSGKTTTLCLWVAWHLARGNARADEILMTTFSRSAVSALKTSLERHVGERAGDIDVSTLHSVAWRIVRSIRKGRWSFIEQEERKRVIARILKMKHDHLSKKWSDAIIDIAQRFMEHLSIGGTAPINGIDRDALVRHWQGALSEMGESMRHEAAERGVREIVFNLCESIGAWQRRSKLITFSDVVPMAMDLMKKRPDAVRGMFSSMRFLFIDEAQDIDRAQALFARELADMAGASVFVIGDENQRIYAWRGAFEGNMRFCAGDATRSFSLSVSFRCPGAHLEFANRVLGPLMRMRAVSADGNPNSGCLYASFHDDSEKQMRSLAHHIASLIKRGVSPGDIAVLVRTNRTGNLAEIALSSARIPYYRPGSNALVETVTWKVIEYAIRISINPNDELAFSYLAPMMPSVGNKRVNDIIERWTFSDAQDGKSLLEMGADGVRPLGALARLTEEIRTVINGPVDIQSITRVYQLIIESGMKIKNSGSPALDDPLRVERHLPRIGAMIEAVYRTMGAVKPDPGVWAEVIALARNESAQPVDGDRVEIRTFHGAKGLEWEYVFVPVGYYKEIRTSGEGLEDEDGVSVGLPDADYMWKANGNGWREHLRLWHVALTRARKGLALSFSDKFISPEGWAGEGYDADDAKKLFGVDFFKCGNGSKRYYSGADCRRPEK